MNCVFLPFSVCELPEVHQQIASCPDALNQMICTSHSPSTQILWSMLVATVFLCLAHSVEGHTCLTQPGIIEGLMDVAQLQKAKTAERMDFVLIRYVPDFCSLFNPLLPNWSALHLALRLSGFS